MNNVKKLLLTISLLGFSISTTLAKQNHDLNKYEKVMVNKTWITTDALDQDNNAISYFDTSVSGFFGIATYSKDGTFKIYSQQGALRLSGDWSITKDGKIRKLVIKNSDGTIKATRDVDNVIVKNNNYTYRVYPEKNNKNVYFDIVHKPLEIILSEK